MIIIKKIINIIIRNKKNNYKNKKNKKIKMSEIQYYFGQYKIHKSQIFFNSKYSFGLVNLKPISP